LFQACSYKNKIDSNYYCLKLKFSCIKVNKVVNFKTSKGDFEVKLFGKDNPVTVSNFLENIENNIYMTKNAIAWIREDFRITHNPALSYATQNHENVIAL